MSTLLQPCCHLCTFSPQNPCPYVITCIHQGPVCHQDEACSEKRARNLQRILGGDEKTVRVNIGAGTCGLAAGAEAVARQVESFLTARDIPHQIAMVGCLGYCQREIFVDIKAPGGPRLLYADLNPENISGLLDEFFINHQLTNRFLLASFSEADRLDGIPILSEVPFFARQQKVVLENCGKIDPASLDEALAHGSFLALEKVLREYDPEKMCQMIVDSGLRGRGGGGFLTGKKWQLALEQIAPEKFIICNADEGDPGAFMDRAVLESDPYKTLEGMLIAGYAIGAQRGVLYCRAEYPLAIKRLYQAIDEMSHWGLLGHNIFDAAFNFELKIKEGAGAFVCGEETALMASIEGKRGVPKARPPYPSESGLLGKPTVINNVETLSNVPAIVINGPAWFAGMGTKTSPGTKVFALSGVVKNNGLVEIPMGTTLRELVYEIGGGPLPDHQIKAVQIGGPSGGLIPENLLDVSVEYQTLKQLGAMMGSGGLVVMDERSCMIDIARYFMEFLKNESCGKCIPCREGTTRLFEIMDMLTKKPVYTDELQRLQRYKGQFHLEDLATTIQECSLCGLGASAANPVLSILRYFRDEFEEHLLKFNCPARQCKGLRSYRIEQELCTGCTRCVKKCPGKAIIGEIKKAHYIITDRCTGCGACASECPKTAITASWGEEKQ
jgi:NADH:ubiquinone oxidoreductase subunit F (NADH-binding)/Pyruvate/2-oxoacid:ferredoxin oxidoreductase delta subunit